jgi:hypothetical protein
VARTNKLRRGGKGGAVATKDCGEELRGCNEYPIAAVPDTRYPRNVKCI